MGGRRIVFIVLIIAPLCCVARPVRGETPPPLGVPNLTDPKVMAQFLPLSLSRLNQDPDFPVLLLAKIGQGLPRFVLVVVDARNGKETWSLARDAAVLYLLLDGPTTIQRAFLDEGFAEVGVPSGRYIAGGPGTVDALLRRLGESHRRSRALAAFPGM